MTRKDVDEVTGTETTGHEWDGIKELNNPLPAWWLWVFYATVLFSVVYWVLMPAWPLASTYTKGLLGASDRVNVANDLKALAAKRGDNWGKLSATPLDQIRSDEKLLQFSLEAGRVAFADNCAGCHGQGAQGAFGYPNLNDDVWLWGGTLADIQLTIRHGVRNEDPDARNTLMPAFGATEILTKAEVSDVVDYVLQLSGRTENAEAAARGKELFAVNCASCHGDNGQGMRDFGAPNLTDKEWLYAGDRATITETVWNARGGVMPSWTRRLDEATINALALYVHTRGGGE